jgi:hypothetical protein
MQKPDCLLLDVAYNLTSQLSTHVNQMNFFSRLFLSFFYLISTVQCFLVPPKISSHRPYYQTPPDIDEAWSLDDSLRPPPFNLRKESILFDANATTMANNNALQIWRFMRRRLPHVLTGTQSDENPWGAIYNTLLVRFPTLVTGVLYGKNVVQGHPLIVDLGDGPFEVPPLVVFGILASILRVPKQS